MKQTLRRIIDMPEWLFLIVGSVFGILTAFMMPALTAPDEGAHFWISYGMFSKYEQVPADLLVSAEKSVKLVNDNKYIENIFQNQADLQGDTIQFNADKEVKLNSQNAPRPASSLDLPHLPQAIGILIGRLIYPSIGVMTTLGRLANLALYLVTIYFIIKHLRHGKLVFVFIALFPMLVHQAASLSYDTMNIVAVFAWMAFMINLSTQKTTISPRQLFLMIGLAILLILTKSSNALLLALIPLLPFELYKNTKLFIFLKDRIPFRINKKIFKVTAMIVAGIVLLLVAGMAYNYIHSQGIGVSKFSEVMFNTFFRPEVNAQLDPILTTGLVGNFGWLWYRLPSWLVTLHLIVLIVILLGDKMPRFSKRFALGSAATFALSVLAITVGMYFLWTLQPFVGGIDAKFAQGMQGRYFTPLLVLLVPFFAYLQRYISVKISRELLVGLTVSMTIFSLMIYLILTYIFFYTPAEGVKDILLK